MKNINNFQSIEIADLESINGGDKSIFTILPKLDILLDFGKGVVKGFTDAARRDGYIK